jgi:hypothetical protein
MAILYLSVYVDKKLVQFACTARIDVDSGGHLAFVSSVFTFFSFFYIDRFLGRCCAIYRLFDTPPYLT